MNMNARFVVFVVFLSPFRVQATETLFNEEISGVSGQTNFAAGYLSILGLTVGADLVDIQKQLGPAPTSARTIFCYASAKAGDRTRLVLEVDTEMGLSDFRVFTADGNGQGSDPKCVLSPAISRVIETPSHLRLGTEVRDLVDQLGPPTNQDQYGMKRSRTGKSWHKLSEETITWWKKNGKAIPSSGHEIYYFDTTISVSIKDGKVNSFSVHAVQAT